METTVHTGSSANVAANRSPNRDWLKWASIVLACIGIFIAGYIVYTEIINVDPACPVNATFDCGVVQHSIYSHVGPIPVAYLGLGGYLLILLVLLLETRIPFLALRGRLIVFGLTLFGVLFSGYLTAAEAFALHKWCLWCMGSAVTMLLLFVASFSRVWRDISIVPDEIDVEA